MPSPVDWRTALRHGAGEVNVGQPQSESNNIYGYDYSKPDPDHEKMMALREQESMGDLSGAEGVVYKGLPTGLPAWAGAERRRIAGLQSDVRGPDMQGWSRFQQSDATAPAMAAWAARRDAAINAGKSRGIQGGAGESMGHGLEAQQAQSAGLLKALSSAYNQEGAAYGSDVDYALAKQGLDKQLSNDALWDKRQRYNLMQDTVRQKYLRDKANLTRASNQRATDMAMYGQLAATGGQVGAMGLNYLTSPGGGYEDVPAIVADGEQSYPEGGVPSWWDQGDYWGGNGGGGRDSWGQTSDGKEFGNW